MKKKIIIHIEDLTVPQEVLLQELLQSFCVGQIEVLEDTTSTLLVGDMQIDVERRQVWRAGSQIELTPMEFDILHLLARRPAFSQPVITNNYSWIFELPEATSGRSAVEVAK